MSEAHQSCGPVPETPPYHQGPGVFQPRVSDTTLDRGEAEQTQHQLELLGGLGSLPHLKKAARQIKAKNHRPGSIAATAPWRLALLLNTDPEGCCRVILSQGGEIQAGEGLHKWGREQGWRRRRSCLQYLEDVRGRGNRLLLCHRHI